MILCCGEALIDMLPVQAADGRDAFAPHPGGAVFNTAIALGRLGVAAGFLCPLSRDLFGARLAAALAAAGVDATLCPRVDRPSTMAFVTLEGGEARYAFFDAHSALSGMRAEELPPIPAAAKALFFGGISLAGRASGAAFAGLAAQAGDRLVMVDPNIRPGFIRDAAAYRARLARLLARADLVKLSDADLRWLDPDRPEAESIAALLDMGPALVLITRGAAGAEAHHRGGMLRASAPPVAVVDTVGAGDTFNAGFLAGLARAGALGRATLRNLPPPALQEALALATRAAALTCSRAGADPPRAAALFGTG